MDFIEVVKQRRSVRKFAQEPIDKEELTEIIRIAAEAPSAGNEQMWHFYIIINDEKKKKMAELVSNKIERLIYDTKCNPEFFKQYIKAATFFVNAPAVIVVATKRYRSKIDMLLKESGLSDNEIENLRARPDFQSIGAVIQNLLLAAWDKGYGTCWMTGPCVARLELEVFLGIQQPYSLAAVIPIGKPQVIPASRGRKPIEEIVSIIE